MHRRALACALGERFGGERTITLAGNRLAVLTVAADLAVLDLRASAARAAGTIPAVGSVGERDVTQAWARWWYEHPDLQQIGCLIYTGAQTGLDCLALWERAEDAVACESHWRLDAAEIRPDLELTADELTLPIS